MEELYNSLHNIIAVHTGRYPLMQPRDGVKLLYQANFGGGHMIPDPQRAFLRLCEEYAATPKTSELYCEDIGRGMMRLYIGGVPEASLASVNALFVMGANEHKGSMDDFLADLGKLEAAAKAGLTPFTAEALDEYLQGYKAEGCPMVSHTEEYRAAYAPSYRIMPIKYRPFLPLIFAIDARIAAGETTVLAVDGQCGSGKSTLAALLQRLYAAAVVQMDDFFLPPTLRSEARLSEPGGNIHYERFLEEAVPHITGGAEFAYTAFDCSVMELGGRVTVPAADLRIVEGSYCLHPKFGRYYDLSVYTRCTMETRLDRLRRRCDDDELMARFEAEWIPMEDSYCRHFAIDRAADMVIDT